MVFTRVRNLSEPTGRGDPLYVAALRGAVAATLNHSLDSIENGADFSAPIPSAAANQTRWAMREGVRLDTVLRAYTAGNKVLEEFLLEGAEGIPSRMLGQILHDLGVQVDRVLERVAAEYRAEGEQTGRSSIQRRAERILTFLDSHDLVGVPDLAYDFDLWHVGIICTGPGADIAARTAAERLGCSLLQVTRDERTRWAWLGTRSEPQPRQGGRVLPRPHRHRRLDRGRRAAAGGRRLAPELSRSAGGAPGDALPAAEGGEVPQTSSSSRPCCGPARRLRP